MENKISYIFYLFVDLEELLKLEEIFFEMINL